MSHPEYNGNEICEICGISVEPIWPQPEGAGTDISYVWVHCFGSCHGHAVNPVEPKNIKND